MKVAQRCRIRRPVVEGMAESVGVANGKKIGTKRHTREMIVKFEWCALLRSSITKEQLSYLSVPWL
jgi:hypothetical protein